MNISNNQIQLKRPVNIKAIVTPRWKDEVQQQLQAQINAVDSQLQQLEMQGQRAIAEIQKQSLQPPGPQTREQIENRQTKRRRNNFARSGGKIKQKFWCRRRSQRKRKRFSDGARFVKAARQTRA